MQSLGGIPTAKASVVVHSHKSDNIQALLVTVRTQTAFDIHNKLYIHSSRVSSSQQKLDS